MRAFAFDVTFSDHAFAVGDTHRVSVLAGSLVDASLAAAQLVLATHDCDVQVLAVDLVAVVGSSTLESPRWTQPYAAEPTA